MRRPVTLATTTLLLSLVLAACTGAGASTAPSTAPSEAASVAPSEAASVAPSEAASPSATADACAKDSLALKTAGTLTIGADNPAFPPFYAFPAEGQTATEPWEMGDPTNGQGFEGATALAIAETLGFTKDQVTWMPVPFLNAVQAGEKDFDIYLTQVSYSEERAQAVDLSDGYFDLNQAVVGLAANDIAKVTTVAGLKDFELGAPVGTTSLTYITDNIQPTKDYTAYDTLDAAVTALKNKQIDGVVVDLPTAFYMRDAQLDGKGQIVGSLPTVGEVEHFSVLLDKGSALTSCVNAAIATLKSDGSLEAITKEWITGQGAPVLTP